MPTACPWEPHVRRWFSRPEGAKTNQPRATPWVPRQRIPGSPERAKQGENRGLATTLLRPFRAEISDAVITQGGAPRLTPLRSALGCHVTPLRGKRRNKLAFATLPIPDVNPNFTAPAPLPCSSLKTRRRPTVDQAPSAVYVIPHAIDIGSLILRAVSLSCR